MERLTSPRKKLKSPAIENAIQNINIKTSVTCANVPESLFDPASAKKHFSKFGRVQKIRLLPKKQMCIIEYDHPLSAERAILNAGAFDGFMFDVVRTKTRVRRKSKREEDPDWVPDSELEEELSAMRGGPSYRIPRQKKMELDTDDVHKVQSIKKVIHQSPIRNQTVARERKTITSHPISGKESPVLVATLQTSLSTSEAATELHQLRTRVSSTADEQWRTLDARDRILRAWGGAGSRVKVGGATIGTCPDMCPEKELLHRQAEHQVMTLETAPDSDGELDPQRAVKQYSRSSADQEMPMCYELRPASVLMQTCAYLLHEIADTKRQVSLADWFHFMWDRFRGIRKDITQQALCCGESIRLVEMCARFHAHCSARLADLEHTQFDQKLNTDNLTKCLQTLKHMYIDVGPEKKPREAEFRGYIALLNLGDANFWWEIKQLPIGIQKSEPIVFAIKIFNALDNNNYVRFFRLVREKANYLQACILLRYFNDVRARALARIVKAYAPRGGSRYPAEELMNSLAFETVEGMKAFINHYGLRTGKDESELTVILDRNQFIEDSDPYPIARSIHLIDIKRINSVGEVIAGGPLPDYEYRSHTLYSSFNKDGKLKENALIAQDQGYNTKNDSNKDVQALKAEIIRLSQGVRNYGIPERSAEPKTGLIKPERISSSPGKSLPTFGTIVKEPGTNTLFSFKPAIPVAPTEVIKNSPEKLLKADTKNVFSFSKPQNSIGSNVFVGSLNSLAPGKSVFESKTVPNNDGLFSRPNNNISQKIFSQPYNSEVIKHPDASSKNVFCLTGTDTKVGELKANVFANVSNSVFTKKENTIAKNIFATLKNDTVLPLAGVISKGPNIFAQAAMTQKEEKALKHPSNIFGTFGKTNNVFTKPETTDNQLKSLFTPNGDATNKLSPGSLFKSAINSDVPAYVIFQSKNKAPTVADNIFNSVNAPESNVYEFDLSDGEAEIQLQQEQHRKMEDEMEKLKQAKISEEEERRRERIEEAKRKEEERRKDEELKMLEEKRKREEERKQEELRKKLEEEKKAELKRKAEEERTFKERVDLESAELIEELVDEVGKEIVTENLKVEIEKMESLKIYADVVAEEIWTEVSDEIIYCEMKAEKFRTEKLMKKWFHVWKYQLLRNLKRRNLLEDTPVWLTDKTPIEEAAYLRRMAENAALKNMNAIHRGYRFTGELRQLPSPEPYNIMEIIKSPLLKRMKQINYPYDKCFFWKVTLVSAGEMKWLYRKIELEKWLLNVFSDRENHDTSDSLIHVQKQSWNNLMDFAISVSLTNKRGKSICSEAMEGSNGVLMFTTEYDKHFIETIEDTLKHKYPYQIIPVAVIIPKVEDFSLYREVEQVLTGCMNNNIISCFKIFQIDPRNICDSLNSSTKSALKWLAKKYPPIPPLEIDYLKSICQRYLGNEIWYRLKSERDSRMHIVLKDLPKLVQCYNIAVDKLTDAITNEELFNYPSFPLEFNGYLDHTTPYPKPYEFVPTNAKNSSNTSAIKDIMKQLKLPNPVYKFQPVSVAAMQDQVRKYCNQIGWFENPEEVVCKVVAVFPNQFSNQDMSCEEFNQFYEQYDLLDFLNIMVYEKINRLNNFDNRYAVYERSVIEEFRNSHWLYEIEVLTSLKHKALEYEDSLDSFIHAKRRKIAIDSMEYLMLEDKDSTMVEDNLKASDDSISNYSHCREAVQELEKQIDEEKKKSADLENLLKAALLNV